MAYKLLPLRTDALFYDFTVPLDGLNFRLEIQWNAREGRWYFNLYDQLGDILLGGKKLVPDFPLLMRGVDRRMPPGELTLIDTTGANTIPGLADLGRTHVLMYVEAAELV